VGWVPLDIIEALRRADVVSESTGWGLMSSHIVVLPFSEKANDKVTSELSSEDLSKEVDVLDESGLEDDWDVGGVKQLDWVWLSETSHLSAAQGEFNSEALEVNDNENDNDCGDKVHKVGSVLPVEGLLESVEHCWLGHSKVEKSNNSSLEFGTLICSDGDWGETFPKNHLTDVCGDKERDT